MGTSCPTSHGVGHSDLKWQRRPLYMTLIPCGREQSRIRCHARVRVGSLQSWLTDQAGLEATNFSCRLAHPSDLDTRIELYSILQQKKLLRRRQSLSIFLPSTATAYGCTAEHLNNQLFVFDEAASETEAMPVFPKATRAVFRWGEKREKKSHQSL